MTAVIKQHLYTDILDEATALLDDINQYPILTCVDKLNETLGRLVQCEGNAAIKLAHKIENIIDSLEHSLNVIYRQRQFLDSNRKKRMTTNFDDSFCDIRYDSFLSQEDVADMFKVHVKTVRKWDSGVSRPAEAVFIVMKTIAYGIHFLPSAGLDWEGWKIQNGLLYDPESPRKYYHTPGTIGSWFLVSQQLHHQAAQEYLRNKAVKNNKNIKVFPGVDSTKWDKAITVLQDNLMKTLNNKGENNETT